MATVLTDNRHYGDIADAIRAKGAEGTFLPSEMATAIASLPDGGGVFHTTGTVDYRGYNAGATFTVPYDRPERSVIVTAKCVGVWYKIAGGSFELSESRDFSLTGLASNVTVPLSFLLISPDLTVPGFTMKTKLGSSRTIRKTNSGIITINPYNATTDPMIATMAAGDMTFTGTHLSQVLSPGYLFAGTEFGTRFQYHIFAWEDCA